MKNKFKIIIFLLVLTFTFILRAHNYEKTPGSGHLDEMLYAWSGLYLIETGTPVSWSTLDYPKSAEVFKGKISYKGGEPSANVTLYKPWLDEPPLFSLISGGSAHFFGADRNGFVSSSFTRFPIIFISSITSFFVFLIANKISGFKLGIFSLILYGVTPIIVFGSRTAMPENLIALLFMVEVFLLLKYKDNQKRLLLLLIPLLSGVAGLAKPTGYFLLPFGIFIYIYLNRNTLRKNIKNILRTISLMIIMTIPFIFAYFLYGFHYDWSIFKTIFSIQSSRPAGFNSLVWMIITPSFGTTVTRDSLYIFSVLSAFFFLFTFKRGSKYEIPLFAFVFWVGVVMITGGENDLLAWYRFPLFPLISIFGSMGILKVLDKVNFFSTFILVGALAGNRVFLVNPFKPNLNPLAFKVIFASLLIPAVLYLLTKQKIYQKLNKYFLIGLLIVGFYINTVYIYNAFEIACESVDCPLVESTWLSRLHFPFVWRYFVIN